MRDERGRGGEADDAVARMPLAYVHLVQILVDALVASTRVVSAPGG